jgi:hypothetical protein
MRTLVVDIGSPLDPPLESSTAGRCIREPGSETGRNIYVPVLLLGLVDGFCAEQEVPIKRDNLQWSKEPIQGIRFDIRQVTNRKQVIPDLSNSHKLKDRTRSADAVVRSNPAFYDQSSFQIGHEQE